MDDDLEVISEEMKQTRSSLTEKLDALEDRVSDTVDEAASAVSGVVENVKETAVDVKRTLDVTRHVERHPWLMMGGAVAVGFVGGRLIGPSRRQPSERLIDRPDQELAYDEYEDEGEEEGGIVHDGLRMVKGLAVGTFMGLLREMATRSLPPNVAPDVVNIVDDLTAKLGGKPVSFGTDDGRGNPNHGAIPHDYPHASEMGSPVGTACGADQVPVGGTHRG